MNTITKICLLIAMVAAGVLWNIYGQPQLDGTSLGWFPFARILYVPVLFGICSFIYEKKKKFTPMKQLVLATVITLSYVFASEAFKEQQLGYVVATLCGTLIVYLALLMNRSQVKA